MPPGEGPSSEAGPTVWWARTHLVVVLGLIGSLLLAFAAQLLIRHSPYLFDGLALYAGAVALFVRTLSRMPWSLAEMPGSAIAIPTIAELAQGVFALLRRRIIGAGICLLLAVLAWFAFGGNRFTALNLALWLGSVAVFLFTFWERPQFSLRALESRLFGSERWTITIAWTTLALMGIVALAIFFRFHQLDRHPVEMGSDHAEKLLDVQEVLNGEYLIFFPRNTGREAFQFYLAAATMQVLDLPLGHMALKVGTALFGVFAIPWIYLLGRELFSRHIGLIAATLAAVSYWHVVLSRVGQRFPFTAAFAAPTFYFLVRAFKENRRNDWLLCGLVIGVGLHTYSPFRVVPLIVVALIALKLGLDLLSSRRARALASPQDALREATSLTPSFWANALLAAVFAGLLLLPLARFATEEPEAFWFRAASRLAEAERPIAGDRLMIFLDNTKNALLMFNYRGDPNWVNSIAYAPQLDPLTGALVVLGVVYLLWRIARYRDRAGLYLLVMFFMLLFPTTLSLAFPEENPSSVRAGGALVPLAVIAALPLGLAAVRLHAAMARSSALVPVATMLVVALVGAVLVVAARLNYQWYFVDYQAHLRTILLPTSEMALVARGFATSVGDLRRVYVMDRPHWVDTRLIGMVAGDVNWHRAISRDEARRLAAEPEAKLFIVRIDDQDGLDLLRELFPNGTLRRFVSRLPQRDFWVYFAPARRASEEVG